MNDTKLFELIRFSIGSQEQAPDIPSSMWDELYEAAGKQSVQGICFPALQKLGANSQGGYKEIGMSGDTYINWMGAAASIQEKNEVQDAQCLKLQSVLSAEGISSSILKGQGLGPLYGELGMFRQPGDIDIYVNCGREKAIVFAKSKKQKKIAWDYKHLHLKAFRGTEVEMHYKVEVSLNLFRNKKLQEWFESPEIQREIFVRQDNGTVTPSVKFNSFYILLHLYRHFLYEGVGLRQLMDYYFVLKNLDDTGFAQEAVRKFGMKKFAGAVSWALDTVFGDENLPRIAPAYEKEGRFFLEKVMEGGNFGKYDKKLGTRAKGRAGTVTRVLKHNSHLLIHYPEEVLWAPVWIVYHWFWKITRKKI